MQRPLKQYLPIKIAAFTIMISLPFIGFVLGMSYQKSMKEKVCERCGDGLIPTSTSIPSPKDIPPGETANQVPYDNPAGWETYRNDEYGFEFEYPASYQETILETQSPTLEGITSFEMVEGKGLDVVLDMNIFSLDYLKTYYAPTGNESFNPEQRKIGKNTFYYYGPGGGGVCYPDQYFLNLTNKILHFRFHGCDNDKTPSDEMKAIEEQILSTFKFVEEEVEVDISNWKTYQGDGYSLKYPENKNFDAGKKSYQNVPHVQYDELLYYFGDTILSVDVTKRPTEFSNLSGMVKEKGIGEVQKIGQYDVLFNGGDTEYTLGSYTFIHNGNEYVFSFGLGLSESIIGDTYSSMVQQEEQIISTIKFSD